ncbi:antibiotic biosynthesis monooxygenase [Sulfurimonas sp. HSL3-7]|uniref:antibiotic biosynthesis monooxygenase n=1 Tax=Sulfonitrofixus jiaomeiensis TaxID=3131938 RepID=UPI0031F7DD0B
MVYLLIRHKVEDYDTWKSMYDEHAAARKAAGSQGARLLRNTNDGNEVVAIISWPDFQHAQAFSNSPDLHAVMQKAGVIGVPDLLYLEEVEETPA